VQLNKYASNLKNVDQMIKALFQRIESFEKESQWTYNLEHTIFMISKILDSLEHEYYRSKAKEEEN